MGLKLAWVLDRDETRKMLISSIAAGNGLQHLHNYPDPGSHMRPYVQRNIGGRM